MINKIIINYEEVDENKDYENIIKKVLKTCLEQEGLQDTKLGINIILTTPEKIRTINKKFRKIDKETDVLSFPMFEKEELEAYILQQNPWEDMLGDIVISILQVQNQANEYGHSFERELAYMVVHGFYHLMGYDHIKEADKRQMREKEEIILTKLEIKR